MKESHFSSYKLMVEDILTVEHDVLPLDGADVFQQGEIDSIGDRVALAADPGDFPPTSHQSNFGAQPEEYFG